VPAWGGQFRTRPQIATENNYGRNKGLRNTCARIIGREKRKADDDRDTEAQRCARCRCAWYPCAWLSVCLVSVRLEAADGDASFLAPGTPVPAYEMPIWRDADGDASFLAPGTPVPAYEMPIWRDADGG
jgi:hypothetical protein